MFSEYLSFSCLTRLFFYESITLGKGLIGSYDIVIVIVDIVFILILFSMIYALLVFKKKF